MKIDNLKLDDEVFDGWYPDWGLGKVVKVYKTTVHIYYPKLEEFIYDKQHVKYLEATEDFFKESVQDIVRRKG